MAFRAEIEIAVKGAQELKRLQNEIRRNADALDSFNRDLSGIANLLPRSFNNINKVLSEAAANFNKVALGTEDASTAAQNYYQANKNLNNALRERVKLLDDIQRAERGAVLSNIKTSRAAREASGFGAFSSSIDTPTQKSIRRNREKTGLATAAAETAAAVQKLTERQEEFTTRTDAAAQASARQTAAFLRQKRVALEVAKINAAAPVAQLLLAPAAAGAPAMSGGARRRITGPVERLGGARTDDEAAATLRLAQATNTLTQATNKIDPKYNRFLPSSELLNATGRGLQQLTTNQTAFNNTVASGIRFQEKYNQELERRQRLGIGVPSLAMGGTTGLYGGSFPVDGPIGPSLSKAVGAVTGMPTFAGLFRGGKRGIGNKVKGRLAKRGGTAAGEALIGGAFPLLFGQGPEAALGGGLGGLAGGLIGGPYGFALSLAGTVLGDLLGQAEFNTPLGKFTGTAKQEEQRTAAQTAGAQAQASANILRDKQDQLKIEKQIFDLQTKALGLSDLQVKREVALTEAKAKRRDALKAISRDESIAPSVAGALMQQVKTEYERKRLLVDQTYIREQELDTVNKLYTAERNRLNQASTMLDMVRKTSASGLSAAQAIGGARVRRLERVAAGIQEQDPARAAGLQAKAASEIAAASERAYKIRLLDIQVAQLQLQIENKIQQSKLAQAKAELSVAKARGATVEVLQAYNDSIKAQQEAVAISSAAVQAGEAQAQFARAEAAAQYSSELQGAVERLDKAGNLAASVGDTAATGIRDLAVVTDRASGAALDLAESWFRVGSAIASAVQQQATAATQQVQLVQTPAPAAPRERSYAEVNGVRTYFAEGGFVTRPTNALIGEGGESEYVIPSSKMSTAMQRYSAGVRGEAVTAGAVTAGSTSTANYSNQQNAYYGGGGGTSVNITTGPVIRMNNRDYVTMTDMQRGMAAAANAGQANMMRQLGRSYAARRSMGL